MLLAQILNDVFSSFELINRLGFKGGTALMFFYGLPRFSTDLDFNLLDSASEKTVFTALRGILAKYGAIHDEAIKRFGSVLVLDYGKNERKLKVEVSNRQYDNHYELKNFLGATVRVMTRPDMFAHKLCALLDRPAQTARDIFDTWFFMKDRTPVNRALVETRMGMPLETYLARCVESVKKTPDRKLLAGIGDLMDEKTKDFVRRYLKTETLSLLELYRQFPITE
jgi:predicted nucleotidyltransferase component of viral defense system